MEENKRTEDVIGEVVIRYQGDYGTLALNINLDLDISDEEMEQLQNLVTSINEIIIPAINKKMTK
ncbi:MAG: hypothetical protein II309_02245 [Bacilli bacterium]|jgi:hypothetical protein|nr:hypothetical protein [Bacilli bacterium]